MHTHDLGMHDYADILCMGDFHIGDKHADLTMVHEAMDWLNAAPNRYGLIAGDVLNMATRSSVSFEYGDMSPRESRLLATKILGRAEQGKILGAVFGNHDYRADKETGISALEWVCTELGIPYYDSEAVLRLKLGHYKHMSHPDTGAKRNPVTYSLYMAHGCRGGRKAGNKLNGVMDYREVIPNADVYVGGHGHDPVIKPDGAMFLDTTRGNVVYQEQLFIICGASLDRRIGSGYASRFVFRPLSKTFPIVRISGHFKKADGRTGD